MKNCIFIYFGILGLCAWLYPLQGAPMEDLDVTTALPAFGSYFPEVLTNQEFVPTPIKEVVESYLRDDFPTETLDRIQFRSGCIVDRVKVAAVGMKSDICYSLIYGVSIKHGGVRWYEFRLDLDVNGNVIRTENVPKTPELRRFAFLDAKGIIAIARTRLPNWDEVKVRYVEKYDAIVWQFTRYTKRLLRGDYNEVLLVDSIKGKVVEQYGYKPMK